MKKLGMPLLLQIQEHLNPFRKCKNKCITQIIGNQTDKLQHKKSKDIAINVLADLGSLIKLFKKFLNKRGIFIKL